ncbi:hypothetical protein GCM10025734_20430 [Kitasatospora paranensis]
MERPEGARAVETVEQVVELGEEPPGVVRAAGLGGQGAAGDEGAHRLGCAGAISCSMQRVARWMSVASVTGRRAGTSGGYRLRWRSTRAVAGVCGPVVA